MLLFRGPVEVLIAGMALSEGNNSIEGEASSFPRLRMFVPVLLAGAAKLLKAAGKRAAFRHF
jgi:hypothetical protein